MSVVIGKSAAITNRDAVPRVKNNPQLAREYIREAIGYVPVTSGDSIGSTYILAAVPSNARISALLIYCTAITTCTADIGIYRTTDDGSAVVSVHLFAAAQTLTVASYTGINVAFGASNITVDLVEQPLWQMLGLAADPNIMYDIVATLTAAAGSAGKLAAKVTFIE